MANINYEQFGGKVENSSESDDYSKYGGKVEDEVYVKPKPVKTFLGELPMPEDVPEFKIGTPENKALVREMINAYAGAPGIKIVGQGIAKGGSLLGNLFKKAFRSSAPYEQNLAKTGSELLQAEKEAAVPKVGNIIEKPTTELEKIENALGKHLNIEGGHDVRAAKGLTNRVNSIENYWSDAFKQFENKIRDAKFQMPENAMAELKYDPQEILLKLKSGVDPRKIGSQLIKEKENPYLKYLIDQAPKSGESNAADFIAKYRDFRDALGGLRADLKSENIGFLEKRKISDAISEAKSMESQIKEVLNKGLGEFKPEWDWLNKGYSEQIYPLRTNPIIKAAKKGKLSTNIVKDLRTNESGMPLVREIIKQDPELLRNVLGQRYRIKPNELHNPTETIREYLEETPELKSLLKEKERLLKETTARKDIALKNKIQAEEELNKILGERSKARKNLTYTGLGLTVTGMPGTHYLGKLLSKEALDE